MSNQATVNKVILLGQIAKEPREHDEHGDKILCFSLVTSEELKRNGQTVIHQEVHQVRINSSYIDNRQFKKGQTVYVQGKIQTRQFVDMENVRRYKTEILANSVELANNPATVSVADPAVNL